MLGSAILNNQILNGIGEVLPFTPLNPGEVSLGGVNLTTFGIRANLRDLDNAAQRIIKTQEVPRGDGLTIIDDYFGEKTLVYRGKLRTTTAEEMAAKADKLKKILSAQNAELDYNIRGVSRRHIVNCSNMDKIFAPEVNWHITVRPIELIFKCFTSFGKDFNYYHKSLFAETSTSANIQLPNSGTRKAPLVTILIYSAAVNLTGVTLNNLTNGKSIEVVTPIVAGDIIEIDQETEQVLKNSSEVGVNFNGFWVDCEVGNNTLNLVQNGSTPSATFDATFKFKPTHL